MKLISKILAEPNPPMCGYNDDMEEWTKDLLKSWRRRDLIEEGLILFTFALLMAVLYYFFIYLGGLQV